jgi:hypothetical protein
MTSNITLESLGFSAGTREQEIQLPLATSGGSGKLSKGATTSVEDRALSLLGAGVAAESVASALGVTPSYISQLLSDDVFATKVSTVRYENLQKHNLRDDSYDSIEDKLLQKLNQQLPLIMKPETLLRAISTINGAKRRGQSAPDQVVNNTNIVTLVLPAVIAEKFSVNIDNQVTRAGTQELHTIPSNTLLGQVEAKRDERMNLLDKEGEVVLDL